MSFANAHISAMTVIIRSRVTKNIIQAQLSISCQMLKFQEWIKGDVRRYSVILSPAESRGRGYCEEEEHFAGAKKGELPAPEKVQEKCAWCPDHDAILGLRAERKCHLERLACLK
jgi:hypothetical protein